jgi:hypothetical protein
VELPSAGPQPPTLNNTQIKNIVFKAMPLAWQQYFIQSNRGISAVTLLELQNFMSNERTFTDVVPANRGGERGRGGGHNNRGNSSTYGRRGRGYEGHSSKRPARDNFNDRNVQQRWGNDAICCTHGGHSWGQCYNNPRGQNFRSPRNPQTNGNGRGRANYRERNSFRGSNNDHRAPAYQPAPAAATPNTYYQQHQQPGVTGGTQGQDPNLEARGNASQNPRGALIPEREAESQNKTVHETESNETINLTHSFYSSCSQDNTNGNKHKKRCEFTNCFLCDSTDHIRTFHAVQKSLFRQTNNKTFDAESIYATFFLEEPLQNHDAYTAKHVNKLYTEKPLGLEEDNLVPSSKDKSHHSLSRHFLILVQTIRSCTSAVFHQEQLQ